jgi:hypothetical protein
MCLVMKLESYHTHRSRIEVGVSIGPVPTRPDPIPTSPFPDIAGKPNRFPTRLLVGIGIGIGIGRDRFRASVFFVVLSESSRPVPSRPVPSRPDSRVRRNCKPTPDPFANRDRNRDGAWSGSGR